MRRQASFELFDWGRIPLALALLLLVACEQSDFDDEVDPVPPVRNQAVDTDRNGFADHFEVFGDWTGDGCDGVPDGRETPDDLHCAVLAVADDPVARTVRVREGVFDANAEDYPADLVALVTLPAATRFEMEPGTWLIGYSADLLASKRNSTRLLATANLVPLDDRRVFTPPEAYVPTSEIDITFRGGYALPRSGYSTTGWRTVNHFGVYLQQCVSCSVRQSEVTDTLHSAIYARSMQLGVIADSVIGPGAGGEFDTTRRARQNGIYLFAANGVHVSGVEVLRNVVRGVGKNGLHTRGERHWSRSNIVCHPDDHGLCDGRRSSGRACRSDADCSGARRCEPTASCQGGPLDGAPCTGDAGCGSGTCVRDRCMASLVRDTYFALNDVESADAFCIGAESNERVRYESHACADALVLSVANAPFAEGEGCDAEPYCIGGDDPGRSCSHDADCGFGQPDDPLDDGLCTSPRAAGASCAVEFRDLSVERPRSPRTEQPDTLVEIGRQAQDVLVSGLDLPAEGANASCVRIREGVRGLSLEDVQLVDCGSAAILAVDRGAIAELYLGSVRIDGYGIEERRERSALRFNGPIDGFTARALSIANRNPERVDAAVRFDDGDLSRLSWRDFSIHSDGPGMLGIWLRDGLGEPDLYEDVWFAEGDFMSPADEPDLAAPAILQDGAGTVLLDFALTDLDVTYAPAEEACFQLDGSGSQIGILLTDLACPTPDVIDGVDASRLASPSRVVDDDLPDAGALCRGEGATWSSGTGSRSCANRRWQ